MDGKRNGTTSFGGGILQNWILIERMHFVCILRITNLNSLPTINIKTEAHASASNTILNVMAIADCELTVTSFTYDYFLPMESCN